MQHLVSLTVKREKCFKEERVVSLPGKFIGFREEEVIDNLIKRFGRIVTVQVSLD